MTMKWIEEAKKDSILTKLLINGQARFDDVTESKLYKEYWPENNPNLSIEAI